MPSTPFTDLVQIEKTLRCTRRAELVALAPWCVDLLHIHRRETCVSCSLYFCFAASFRCSINMLTLMCILAYCAEESFYKVCPQDALVFRCDEGVIKG